VPTSATIILHFKAQWTSLCVT